MKYLIFCLQGSKLQNTNTFLRPNDICTVIYGLIRYIHVKRRCITLKQPIFHMIQVTILSLVDALISDCINILTVYDYTKWEEVAFHKCLLQMNTKSSLQTYIYIYIYIYIWKWFRIGVDIFRFVNLKRCPYCYFGLLNWPQVSIDALKSHMLWHSTPSWLTVVIHTIKAFQES